MRYCYLVFNFQIKLQWMKFYLHFNGMHEIDIWHIHTHTNATQYKYEKKNIARAGHSTKRIYDECVYVLKSNVSVNEWSEKSSKTRKRDTSIYLLTARINVKQMVSLSNWSSVCCLFIFLYYRTAFIAFITFNRRFNFWTIHLSNNIYYWIYRNRFQCEFHIEIALCVWCRTKEPFIHSIIRRSHNILPWITFILNGTQKIQHNLLVEHTQATTMRNLANSFKSINV